MRHYSLTIENRIDELAKVATFVEQICEDMAWGPDKVFNLNLVLEEAITNVVMYAYPEGEMHEIWLQATVDDGQLCFVLEDEGQPFDPTKVPEADVTLSAEERPIGGLGIFLIKQMMDEVTYCYVNDRNQLTMRKNMNDV